jgi:hypothetical protein
MTSPAPDDDNAKVDQVTNPTTVESIINGEP